MNAALNPQALAVPNVTSDAETRNQYFDRLFTNPDLMWLGQNTNHFPLHPAVRKALHDAIDDESFHAYAPPLGMEALRAAIVADLGVTGQSAVVTDGAVAALALACRAFCAAGQGFVTTDPGWKWPLQFAARAGSVITEIPIYGPEYGFKLSAEALAASTDDRTAVRLSCSPSISAVAMASCTHRSRVISCVSDKPMASSKPNIRPICTLAECRSYATTPESNTSFGQPGCCQM